MTKVRTYLLMFLLTAGAVIYVGRNGFRLPLDDQSHELVLSAGWKLNSPIASADIDIEWAVGAKYDTAHLHVDRNSTPVWNHYEHGYKGEYSWIRVISWSAKTVSCGVNYNGAWAVTPQDKSYSAYCYFPLNAGPRKR